jgi:hypothetical protein
VQEAPAAFPTDVRLPCPSKVLGHRWRGQQDNPVTKTLTQSVDVPAARREEFGRQRKIVLDQVLAEVWLYVALNPASIGLSD